MAVTLKDLATACGLDISTVSRALKDDPKVTPKTKDKIKALAQTMGYRPNLAARSLAAGKTKTIWLIVSSFSNTAENMTAQYASTYLADKGYDLLIAVYRNRLDIYQRFIQRLAQGVADGAFLLQSTYTDPDEVVQKLAQSGFPLIFLDRNVEKVDALTVTTDNYGCGKQLTQLCLDAGARDFIVYYTGSNSVVKSRIKGTLAPLIKQGIRFELVKESHPINLEHKLGKRVGIIANSQDRIQELVRNNVELLQGKELYFGCFDLWRGEPYPAQKVFVCEQDLKKMAEVGCDNMMALLKKGAARKAHKVKIPALNFLTIERSF